MYFINSGEGYNSSRHETKTDTNAMLYAKFLVHIGLKPEEVSCAAFSVDVTALGAPMSSDTVFPPPPTLVVVSNTPLMIWTRPLYANKSAVSILCPLTCMLLPCLLIARSFPYNDVRTEFPTGINSSGVIPSTMWFSIVFLKRSSLLSSSSLTELPKFSYALSVKANI